MNGNKILIAGGGTGGHLIPGVALYEEFRDRGIIASLLIGKGDIKSTVLKDVADEDIFIYGARTVSFNLIKLLLFIKSFIFSLFKAIYIIKKCKFNGVIGMGGYVSAPALVAAKLLRTPIFLCEQNTVPGKVTILFSGYALKIFTTFKESEKYLKPGAPAGAIAHGNPIRKSILMPVPPGEAKGKFNMKHCKKVILVLGGSQGALQINEIFLEIIKLYPEELKDYGVIWSTGNYSYNRFVKELQNVKWNGSIFLSPFIENMGLAYRAGDIAISRSGAGVIMELAAAGIPSLLIPYPYAADNHQEKNADVFHEAGASVKIDSDNATPEKVGKKLISILRNADMLAGMKEKALSISRVNASSEIVSDVLNEISEFITSGKEKK